LTRRETEKWILWKRRGEDGESGLCIEDFWVREILILFKTKNIAIINIPRTRVRLVGGLEGGDSGFPVFG
jgi:hypothetical protein